MSEGVIWKDIPNYEGMYQISNNGDVKSLERLIENKVKGDRISKERLLKQSTNSVGYKQVVLCKDGITKTFSIHKLLAICFLGFTPRGVNVVIDHIDNNKLNNSLDNLQVTSIRQNTLKEAKSRYTTLKGANWHSKNKTWCSSIVINGKIKHLGTFQTDTEAHEAYMNALNNLIENE